MTRGPRHRAGRATRPPSRTPSRGPPASGSRTPRGSALGRGAPGTVLAAACRRPPAPGTAPDAARPGCRRPARRTRPRAPPPARDSSCRPSVGRRAGSAPREAAPAPRRSAAGSPAHRATCRSSPESRAVLPSEPSSSGATSPSASAGTKSDTFPSGVSSLMLIAARPRAAGSRSARSASAASSPARAVTLAHGARPRKRGQAAPAAVGFRFASVPTSPGARTRSTGQVARTGRA